MAKASTGKAGTTSRAKAPGSGLPSDGALIWIGPAIPFLKMGATFSARRAPGFIGRLIESCPEARKLFVGAREFAAAKREVERIGSELNQAARALAKRLGA